jgi:hypothetical protein
MNGKFGADSRRNMPPGHAEANERLKYVAKRPLVCSCISTTEYFGPGVTA